MFCQRFSPITGKMEWVVEDENYDLRDEIARSAYADMLHDDERNKKYHAATQEAVQKIKSCGQKIHMLDIGTGSGLLAMLAATSGADRATACEAFPPIAKVAAEIIKKNGFQDRIKVISKRSTDVTIGPENCDMDSKANLLVTELWDTELIGEGAIPTLTDACQRLLEPGFVCVPAAGTIYAQVFTCNALWDMHQLDPDKLPCGAQIKLPDSMTECLGTTSGFDLHVDEMHDHEIAFLSDPVAVLRFDFCENKLNSNCPNVFSIPNSTTSFKEGENKEAQYYSESIATKSGVAHGVVMWWLLDMDVEGKITLETAPRWAHPDGDNCQWRDHWMQAVYYLKKPLPIKEGQDLNVYCCHDEYSLWFDVQHKQSLPTKVQRPICTCGAHITWSRHRYCMLNDKERNLVFKSALNKLVKSGCSNAFCVSDTSLLPVAAAKAGFNKPIPKISRVKELIVIGTGRAWEFLILQVLALESSISFTKLLRKVLDANGLGERVHLLDKSFNDICKDDLPNSNIDAVVGELYFNTSLFPWHNLYFWYGLTTIRRLVNKDVKVMPQRGTLRGLAVEFKDLWKYHSPVGRVEGFDLTLFDQLIERSKLKNEEMDGDWETCIALEPHHVWEYPSKPLTDVIELMDFDFTTPLPEKTMMNSGVVPITGTGSLHCVVLWMDFQVMDDLFITNGLRKNCKSTGADSLDWVRHTKQAVYFMRCPTHLDQKAASESSLAFTVTFNAAQGDVKLNFNLQR